MWLRCIFLAIIIRFFSKLIENGRFFRIVERGSRCQLRIKFAGWIVDSKVVGIFSFVVRRVLVVRRRRWCWTRVQRCWLRVQWCWLRIKWRRMRRQLRVQWRRWRRRGESRVMRRRRRWWSGRVLRCGRIHVIRWWPRDVPVKNGNNELILYNILLFNLISCSYNLNYFFIIIIMYLFFETIACFYISIKTPAVVNNLTVLYYWK